MKYKEVILPIVENANEKIYKLAKILSFVGVAILVATVFFVEVGLFRTIVVILGLVLLALPFILRFFLEKHKKIGLVRFSQGEILTKMKGEEPVVFNTKDFSSLQFSIVDYEGETKGVDLLTAAGRMNVRSGSDNCVYWLSDKGGKLIQFKLENELEKRKAIYFLKMFKDEIENK